MHQFTNKTLRSEPTANPPPAAEQDKDAFAQTKHEQEKEPKTKGEKIFDRTLYTGINWALNLVISIAATVLLMETTRGKFMYNKQGDAINHAVKGRFGEAWNACKTGFVEPFKPSSTHIQEFQKKIDGLRLEAIRTGASLENIGLDKSGGHTAFEVFSLCTGGNVLLIPTKLIEDKKPEIVAKLEKKYDGIEEPVDHHFPKKTWGDLITARVTALATVMGIGYIANKPFNALRVGTQNLANEHLPIKNPRNKELGATTLGLLPVESITCAIAAAELYVVSKFKSAFREKKKAEKEERHHQEAPPSAPSDTAAPPENTAREKDVKATQFTKNAPQPGTYKELVDNSRAAESAAATR